MARVQWCIGNTTLREAARLKGGKGVKSILYKNLQYFHLWEKL